VRARQELLSGRALRLSAEHPGGYLRREPTSRGRGQKKVGRARSFSSTTGRRRERGERRLSTHRLDLEQTRSNAHARGAGPVKITERKRTTVRGENGKRLREIGGSSAIHEKGERGACRGK